MRSLETSQTFHRIPDTCSAGGLPVQCEHRTQADDRLIPHTSESACPCSGHHHERHDLAASSIDYWGGSWDQALAYSIADDDDRAGLILWKTLVEL